jgi:hypothetical protein
MNKAMAMISGFGIGAGLMYIFDPDRGKRRRAQVSDKARHMAKKTNDAIGKTSRDLANRVSGIVAEAESLFISSKALDEVLVARVRSKLGRVVSHPSSINVTAIGGEVILAGPVLANEVDQLLKSAGAIKGVTGVENRLEVHEQAGNVSGLQDGRVNLGERCALMQTNWSPTTRLLAGAAGGALALYAAKRRGLIVLQPTGWSNWSSFGVVVRS